MALTPRFALALALAALPLVVVPAAQDRPTIKVSSPTDQDFVIDKVTLEAEVAPPTTAFKRVDFFVNDRVVCTVLKPPIRCAYDAGPSTSARRVHVVMLLPDGQQVYSDEVVTKGIDLEESTAVQSVLVAAQVRDKRGDYRKDIPRTAFRVFEDGVAQEITYFESENVPLDIVVAVDISGSMQDDMPVLKKAVKTFISAVRPIDSVTVIAFNDHIFRLPTRKGSSDGTVDNGPLLKAVDQLSAGGGTALHDTLYRSVKLLQTQTYRARAVIAFTDGEDRNSTVGPDAVEKAIKQSDARLFLIVQGAEANTKEVRQVVKRLTQFSGGKAYSTDKINELEPRLLQIASDIQRLYLLSYTPTNAALDGTYRKIVVKLEGLDAEVSARPGYMAAAPER
jgi:VWFA-related protein